MLLVYCGRSWLDFFFLDLAPSGKPIEDLKPEIFNAPYFTKVKLGNYWLLRFSLIHVFWLKLIGNPHSCFENETLPLLKKKRDQPQLSLNLCVLTFTFISSYTTGLDLASVQFGRFHRKIRTPHAESHIDYCLDPLCIFQLCSCTANEGMVMKLCWVIDCLPYSWEQDSISGFFMFMKKEKCSQHILVRHNIMSAA